MSREKQIDEMKNCLCDVLDFDYDDERGVTKVDAKTTAERLCNAGYRRFDYLADAMSEEIFAWKKHYESLFETAKATIREEVAREIFEDLETVLYYTTVPVIRADGTVGTRTLNGIHIRNDDYETIKKKYTEKNDEQAD